MRFRQMVLAEIGSFRRAGAALKIFQPALTRAVQALENELGVRIFDWQLDFGQMNRTVRAPESTWHAAGFECTRSDLPDYRHIRE